MAQFKNIYKVELNKGTAPVIPLRQIYYGDVEANRIGAIVLLNGEEVTLSGSCSGTAILADGSTVAITGTVDGSQAYVELPAACYSVEGQIEVYVKLTASGVTTTLIAAVGTVRLTETDTVIDPGTIIPSVAALIEDIDEAEEALADAIATIPADYSALLASIAPTFSIYTEYTAGTYVWYSGTLYRFTADHAAGAWTGSDAAAAVIGADLASLKSAIDGIDDTLSTYITEVSGKNLYNPATVTEGIIIANDTGAITASATREATDYIPVEVGKKVTVTENYIMNGVAVQNLVKPIYVTFYDNTKTFMTGGKFNTQNVEITAGCAYIRVSLSILSEGHNWQIELTSNGTPTPYEAYQEPVEKVIADFVTDVTAQLLSDLEGIPEADGIAEGKALMAKTVSGGKVTAWEFGDTVTIDDTLTQAGEAADAKATGDAISGLETEIGGEIESIESDLTALGSVVRDWETVGDTDLIFPYHSARRVRLSADSSATLSIRGITAADLDHMGTVTYNKVELVSGYTGKGKKYKITELGNSALNYRVDGTASGLISGHTYRICLKVTDPQNDASGGGHYAQVMVGTKTVKSYGTKVSKEAVYTATFTASATSHSIYIYPFMTNNTSIYQQSVNDEFVIEDFYLNEVYDGYDLFTHEGVISETASGADLEYDVSGKMFIATGSATATVSISRIKSGILTINGAHPDFSGDMTVKSHLQGKTVVCFGDSITNKGYDEYRDYPYLSSLITGLNTINVGIGGTSMRYRTNYDNWNKISFAHMADMIASGDFTDIQTLGNTSGFEVKDRCAQLYPIISAIDWNSVDIITLAFGANDHETSAIVNHRDDESDKMNKYTYLGAFRYALETILAQYPHIQFLVITPVFRFWTIQGEYTDSDKREFPDIDGTTSYYYEWGDDLMKCAKDEYHVPVVDFYRELGISEVNHAWFSTDGVHPDWDGLARMASHLASALMSKF